MTLSARGTDATYTLTEAIPAAKDGGTDVKIEVMGQHTLKGSTTQYVSSGGSATWSVEIDDPSVFVRVTRLDTGTCATLTLAKMSDFSGLYNLTFTEKTKWASDTDWETAQLTPIQARVEQNGTEMKITFLDQRGIVLTGTYDEASRQFVGLDRREPDNPYGFFYWQRGNTTITFDPNTNTGKGNLDVSFAIFVGGSSMRQVVDFDMTKVPE